MSARKGPSVPFRVSSRDGDDGRSHVISAHAPGIVVTVTLQHDQWGPADTANLLESVAAAVRANGAPIVSDPHTTWKPGGVC